MQIRLPLIASVCFSFLLTALCASPARANLDDPRSFANFYATDPNASFGQIGKLYPDYVNALSRTEQAPPTAEPNPRLGGSNGFAGSNGGSNSNQPIQGQGQQRNYQEAQGVVNTSSGLPMGQQMSPVNGSCPPGVHPTWSCGDPTKNSTSPTPPDTVAMSSLPVQDRVPLASPELQGMWGNMAKTHMSRGTNHNAAAGDLAAIAVTQAVAAADLSNTPQKGMQAGAAGAEGAAKGASEAMADAFNPTWTQMLILSATPLLNVANEATGSACSASQPIKTYENVVYLVMQAYKNIYLPMAILLLLPGAVITQTKSLVTAGVLNNANDEDAVSPFTGILRSMIAIFLIPATQLIVSYTIDVGNSLQYEVSRNINYLNIFMWGDEQVFRAPVQNAIATLRPASAFQVLGKMSQGPEDQSGFESQSPATIMLQTMVNSAADSAAFGLVILCAFQIAMACYLMLMGPIAAAFYAWPGSTGSLFTRVFANWVDAMINLALWRFWWCIVLLCIDVRLGWITGLDMYTEWEMLMFLAFLTILCYVPFNPFDYKAGEMVSQIMSKADQGVNQATSK
jgi:hypothetical protein